MSLDLKGRLTRSIDLDDYEPGEGAGKSFPSDPKPLSDGTHNVVTSSLGISDLHMPVLDLDIPHQLVPSSTPGHSHLYLDLPMGWDQYARLLEVLAEVGVIEKGYCEASLARGFSAARLPGFTKDMEG